MSCRPVCRKTAASNIKTTKLVFFVTFSSGSAHHSLLSSYVTLNTITVIFYLSVTDVSRTLRCVLDNIQSVTVLVVIPGNIHDANCTGGLPCLAPDHTPALIITHYMGGSGSSKSHIMGSCSSYSGSSLRHQIHHQTPIHKIPVPSIRPSSSELDLCFR